MNPVNGLRQKIVKLWSGDLLLLYTDGIPEAQNSQDDFLGEERLLEAALAKFGSPAHEVQAALLDEVRRFTNHAPRQDNIALLVIRRQM